MRWEQSGGDFDSYYLYLKDQNVIYATIYYSRKYNETYWSLNGIDNRYFNEADSLEDAKDAAWDAVFHLQ